jgi:hypothetical protein
MRNGVLRDDPFTDECLSNDFAFRRGQGAGKSRGGGPGGAATGATKAKRPQGGQDATEEAVGFHARAIVPVRLIPGIMVREKRADVSLQPRYGS